MNTTPPQRFTATVTITHAHAGPPPIAWLTDPETGARYSTNDPAITALPTGADLTISADPSLGPDAYGRIPIRFVRITRLDPDALERAAAREQAIAAVAEERARRSATGRATASRGRNRPKDTGAGKDPRPASARRAIAQASIAARTLARLGGTADPMIGSTPVTDTKGGAIDRP